MKVAFTLDGEIRYARFFAYCKSLDMPRRDGYYITNNVTNDYEHIYN
jgi:hypothetical protein